jgi:hypothetical protein
MNCTGLCFNKSLTFQKWKTPSSKSSSEHILIKTKDNPIYSKPTNEGVKYSSYDRVIRRRRNVDTCCTK